MSITVETNEGVETPDDATSENEMGDETNDESESEETDEKDEESDTSKEEGDDHDDSEGDSEEEDEDEPKEEDDTEEEEEGEEEEEEEPKPKRRSGFKKRIDKLNKRISDRDEQILAQQDELEDLRQRLQAKEQGGPSENEGDHKSKGTKSDHGIQKPKMDDFEEYEDYIEALTDYKVKIARAEEKAEAKKAAVNTEFENRVTKLQTRASELSKEIKDFEKTVRAVDYIKATPELQQALLEAEDGARLMYELARDPAEFRRINKLGRSGIDRALGRIEARIETSKSSGESTKKVVKKKTTAPKPIEKVGTKGKGVAHSIYDADKMSQSEFEAAREKALKQRAR